MKPTKGERFLEAFNDIDEKYLKEAMNYTMKKRFNFKPIIAIAACAALALAAVPVAKHFAGNPLGTQGTTATTQAPSPIVLDGNLTVLFTDSSSDSNSGIIIEKETDFDGIDEQFTDSEKIGTKQTVTIAGVTYTGTYVDSTKSDYYGDDTDNYRASAKGGTLTFSINKKTGVCTKFFFAINRTNTEKKLTSDECYPKVIEHLKEYVEDIESYTLVNVHNQGGTTGYLFQFYRMIDGIKTSECIDVRVDYNGKVYNHSLYSIGEMKNVDISAIKTADIEAAISDKLNATYRGYDKIEHLTKDIMFSRLANGKYAFVCRVSIDATNTEENSSYYNLAKILVEVN